MAINEIKFQGGTLKLNVTYENNNKAIRPTNLKYQK